MLWQNISIKLLIYVEFVVLVLNENKIGFNIGNGNELSLLVVYGKIETDMSKFCLATKSNNGG